MTTRSMYKVGVVLLAAGLFGACSSSNPVSGGNATVAPGAPGATTGEAGTSGDGGAATPGGETPAADDLCSVIPDLATIEAAIGVPVKDPLGIGDAGFQQSCTLLRGTDDFPGIVFTYTPGLTIAAQIEFAEDELQHRHRAARRRRWLLCGRGRLGLLGGQRRPVPGERGDRWRQPLRIAEHAEGLARDVTERRSVPV